MNWFTENLPSVGILAAVVLIVAALAWSLIKAKKSGKGMCAGCSGCSAAGKCHGACGTQNGQNSK